MSKNPFRKRPRARALAILAGCGAAAMVAATATNSFAVTPAKPPSLVTNVAVVNTGGGGAVVPGSSLSSMETFSAGTVDGNQLPLYLNKGSQTGLNNPVDIKFDPTGSVLAVVSTGAAPLVPPLAPFLPNVGIFAINANSNTGPIFSITTADDAQMDIPDGLAWDQDFGNSIQDEEASTDLWLANLQPAACLTTPAKSCTDTSTDFCGFGSVQAFEFLEELPFTPTVDFTINPCGLDNDSEEGEEVKSLLGGPEGMAADEIGFVNICVPGYGYDDDPCRYVGGKSAVGEDDVTLDYIFSDRLWVVNALSGTVNVYLPNIVQLIQEELGPLPIGNGLVSFDGKAQYPIGGLFLTAVNGEKKSQPAYVALSPNFNTFYVTDNINGSANRGEIKAFSAETVDVCASPIFTGTVRTPPSFEEGCDIIVQGGGIQQTNVTVLNGTKSGLNDPFGIAVFDNDDEDQLIVANAVGSTILQFAPGITSGTTAAWQVAIVPGAGNANRTGLDWPVGLDIPPQEIDGGSLNQASLKQFKN